VIELPRIIGSGFDFRIEVNVGMNDISEIYIHCLLRSLDERNQHVYLQARQRYLSSCKVSDRV
jgi:hypothetical protein